MSSFKTAVLRPFHPSDEPRSFGGAMLRTSTVTLVNSLPLIPTLEAFQQRQTRKRKKGGKK